MDTSHPTLSSLYQSAVQTAADLWAGADVADMLNSDYLRGQVELIVNLTGCYADGYDDPREEVEMDIVAAACGIQR